MSEHKKLSDQQTNLENASKLKHVYRITTTWHEGHICNFRKRFHVGLLQIF